MILEGVSFDMRWHGFSLVVGILAGATLMTAACGGGETTGTASTVTIRGVVEDYARSARVIALKEPVKGFNMVAIEDSTEFAEADGSTATAEELRPGVRIEASGRPGEGGALLAGRVVILSMAMPTATP